MSEFKITEDLYEMLWELEANGGEHIYEVLISVISYLIENEPNLREMNDE